VAFSQKRALKEGRTIVFCDQSVHYLLPTVVRTYVPVGKTPILKENLTLEGKLYMIEQERAIKGKDVVRFLKHLIRQILGKVLVVWDGLPIHRGGVNDFLARGQLLGCNSNSCPAMLRISIPRRESESTSSAWC
jgi:hypothetical protein